MRMKRDNTNTISRGMSGHHSAIMRTDEWITPPEIITRLGEFDLDPCAPIRRPWDTAKKHYSITDDGLSQMWHGRVWLNPPYGPRVITGWMRRMAMHNNGIALVFARTETQFFQRYVFPVADSLLFIEGRIAFCNVAGFRAKASGGAPSVLISYGKGNSGILESSGIKGKHIPLCYTPIIVVGISPTWISVVHIAVRQFGDDELKPVYEMVERIAPDKVSKNQHWKAKVRQTIQIIRKKHKAFEALLEDEKQAV